MKASLMQIHKLSRAYPDTEIGGWASKDSMFGFDFPKSSSYGAFLPFGGSKGFRDRSDGFLWHSHIEGGSEVLTVQDVSVARELNTPVLSFHVPTSTLDFYSPRVEDIKPFTDRPWHPAYLHCWDLVCDYFLGRFGIYLERYYMSAPDEYETEGFNAFASDSGLKSRGFSKVVGGPRNFVQKGDVILFANPGKNPTHCGVVFDEGVEGDMDSAWLYHQVSHNLSRRANYARAMRHISHSVWRHESQWEPMTID